MNIKELMQRREQINEDINNVFLAITSFKEMMIEALDQNDFDSVQIVSNHLCKYDQQIKIIPAHVWFNREEGNLRPILITQLDLKFFQTAIISKDSCFN